MTYVPPTQVLSPQQRIDRIEEVPYDGGEGGWSAALGTWEGRPGTLALRWNGSDSDVNGLPQATGQAAWFICPPELQGFLIDPIRGFGSRAPTNVSEAIARAQAMTARLLKNAPGATVDDFIRERRREADRE